MLNCFIVYSYSKFIDGYKKCVHVGGEGIFPPAPQTLWKATGLVLGLKLATCIIYCTVCSARTCENINTWHVVYLYTIEASYKGNNVPGPTFSNLDLFSL